MIIENGIGDQNSNLDDAICTNDLLNTLFTQPLPSGRIWHMVNFFKRSLTGLNSEFSFS